MRPKRLAETTMGDEGARRAGGALAGLTLVGALLALSLPTSASAATPASDTITPESGPVSWAGATVAVGANVSNAVGDQLCAPSYPGGPDDAGAVPGVHQCDVFELTVDIPSDY